MVDEQQYEKTRPYHVIVPKYWFRQKPIFTQRLSDYERKLRDVPTVNMEFNAGNMIYQMMRRLTAEEWDMQDALIHSYRNLMYKISYVYVAWNRSDIKFLHITGQKNDVMWALSFISQVYPDIPIACQTVPEDKRQAGLRFDIQNGAYVGANAMTSLSSNDAVPDIWAFDEVEQEQGYASMPSVTYRYDPNFRPKDNDIFALPDGRVAYYISMDRRFDLANSYGNKIDVMSRHNISASFMKDFEDMVRRQTQIEYELYHVRYTAFMNKAHMLEHMFKGLDATLYDTLPIAERGLPQAKMDTIERTNMMDKDSLKYVIDKVQRNQGHIRQAEASKTMKSAAKSIISRIRGYNIEYWMYINTKTPQNVAAAIHNDNCVNLYNDFAKLDSLGELHFPIQVYKLLCNDPEGGAFNMTDVERQVIRNFGRGYLDFLSYQLSHDEANSGWKRIYQKAMVKLENRYLSGN